MIQREKGLFVVFAFASVIAVAGFEGPAEQMINYFSTMNEIYKLNTSNLKTIFQYAQTVLPSWLTGFRTKVKNFQIQDLQQFDMFVAFLKGSNGTVEKAVGIYNSWIFDVTKKLAIPLLQKNLNSCFESLNKKETFQCFSEGFHFR